MLPLHTHATVAGVNNQEVLKILTLDEARRSTVDPEKCLIWFEKLDNPLPFTFEEGWRGIVCSGRNTFKLPTDIIVVQNPKIKNVIQPGDVIRVSEGKSLVSVLYRRGSNSNTLFSTERCNSRCIMCSQPPRDIDDQWRVSEMLETIPLIDPNEGQLGISGGEPTLLGDDLLAVIVKAKECLPNSGLHILSNGRRFSDHTFARSVCAIKHPDLTWGIPLYSDAPETHDYIVQARGAWDETLDGLYNLAKNNGSIEIRIVIQKDNIRRLGELAYFIFRNLSFVKHVAFMGIEPIGYARGNRDKLWIDPADCADFLNEAVFFLSNRGINVSIYNLPLCTLPPDLWPYCRKSISDWKNVFLPECGECKLKGDCCGFFHSIDGPWISSKTNPILSQKMIELFSRREEVNEKALA